MSAFNAERWLPSALDSALAQTYPHREIIVVNDGSTDGTGAVLETYAQKHDLRVITQPNRGQCAALNRGLAEARGDYVKFFDSDDILSPDFVATQVAALAGRTDRLAYGTWGRFYTDPSEARFTPHPGWHDSDSGLDWLVETWTDTEPMYQCALFLIPRTLLLRTGGWDERLSLINDFEFFTRVILQSGGLVFTPGVRLYYRSGLPGSLSQTKSRRALESARLSTELAIRHVLAAEDSPRTRRVSANMLQAFVHTFYPDHPDLWRPLLAEIRRLGGATVQPGGGSAFCTLCRFAGWRAALRLRKLAGRRPG